MGRPGQFQCAAVRSDPDRFGGVAHVHRYRPRPSPVWSAGRSAGDPQTFQRSKLDWDEVDTGEHARLLQIYRDLIALRRSETDLTDPWLDHMVIDYDEDGRWIVMRRGQLAIACNLGAESVAVPFTGEV